MIKTLASAQTEWSIKHLLPPPKIDLTHEPLREIEISIAANHEKLRERIQLENLRRILHDQICLGDEALSAAAYFIQGRTGLTSNALESIAKVRLRKSSWLVSDGSIRDEFELTVKSTKEGVGNRARAQCTEIAVKLRPDEFADWHSNHPIDGRLSKLRLLHVCGSPDLTRAPLVAEIDHVLDAGRKIKPAPMDVLKSLALPKSPLKFNLIDFEVTNPDEVTGIGLNSPQLAFLCGIAVDLSDPEIARRSQPLRKGTLARGGITRRTSEAEGQLSKILTKQRAA